TIHVNDIAVILYADVGLSFALQTSVRYLIRGTCADGQDCNFPVTLRSRSSRLRPNPNCDGAYGSQKRDTKNSHQRRGGRNDVFGRFRDTETASRPANGAESRASLVLIRNNRRRLDCLAGAPGFEPGNGGIKIRLVPQSYQRSF